LLWVTAVPKCGVWRLFQVEAAVQGVGEAFAVGRMRPECHGVCACPEEAWAVGRKKLRRQGRPYRSRGLRVLGAQAGAPGVGRTLGPVDGARNNPPSTEGFTSDSTHRRRSLEVEVPGSLSVCATGIRLTTALRVPPGHSGIVSPCGKGVSSGYRCLLA